MQTPHPFGPMMVHHKHVTCIGMSLLQGQEDAPARQQKLPTHFMHAQDEHEIQFLTSNKTQPSPEARQHPTRLLQQRRVLEHVDSTPTVSAQ